MRQGKIPITTGLAQLSRIQVNISVHFHPQGERFHEFESSKNRRRHRREDFRRWNVGPSFALQALNTQRCCSVCREAAHGAKVKEQPCRNREGQRPHLRRSHTNTPGECMSPPPFPGARAHIKAHVPAGSSQLGSPGPHHRRPAPCLWCPKGGCPGSSRAGVMQGLCGGLLATDA